MQTLHLNGGYSRVMHRDDLEAAWARLRSMEREHASELGDKQREIDRLRAQVAALEAEARLREQREQREARGGKERIRRKGERDDKNNKGDKSSKKSRRSAGRIASRLFKALGGSLGVIAFFGIFALPICQRCHGRSYKLALALANACPEVTDKLGSPVGATIGCNGGKSSCSGNRTSVSWGLDISGSKGRAKMRYNYSKDGHIERIYAYLYLDGKRIDLRRCAIAAGKGDLLPRANRR